jgi:hypothetical protein
MCKCSRLSDVNSSQGRRRPCDHWAGRSRNRSSGATPSGTAAQRSNQEGPVAMTGLVSMCRECPEERYKAVLWQKHATHCNRKDQEND